ncbi:PRC-barrel domain-containing protein [Methanosphaera sp.]
MNAKDIFGMKIISKDAKDVAKVAEMSFNVKTYEVTKIIGSLGNPINKKYYNLTSDDIEIVGDYILLNKTIDDISEDLFEKIPDDEENDLKINNAIGKTVLDSQGNEAGKLINIDIDFEELTVSNLTIGKSSSFGKPKDTTVLNKDDIIGIGDYILINKVIKTEEPEEENDSEEDSEEKINVDIE